LKTLREKVNRRGKREITVELEDEDKLMCFRDDRYYRLGVQVDDIVHGNVIQEAACVYWCSIEQRWLA
jgi:hypothetical protein